MTLGWLDLDQELGYFRDVFTPHNYELYCDISTFPSILTLQAL